MIKKLLLLLGVLALAAIIGGVYWFKMTGGVNRFTGLVEEAACADKRNNLYQINNRYILWVREGSCPDASYRYTLYDATPKDEVCRDQDSIAGPVISCDDESLNTMFVKMVHHLTEPDLGLGSEYTVKKLK